MPTTKVRSAWEGGNLQYKTLTGGYAAGIVAVSGATTSAADALAIPITHRVVAKTTGADAEALTLADGEPGQELMIYLAVDGGGDGTLTPTTKTGFATIVFADAGDQVHLRYVDDTIGWTIVGYAGLAAPPVVTA
jgi:enoyl-CoA hydratase/carnithine racemase